MMDRNACKWTRNRVEARLDGELVLVEREHFDTHVAACAACRREVEVARNTLSALRGLPERRCPDDVVDRVVATVGVEAFGSGGTRGSHGRAAARDRQSWRSWFTAGVGMRPAFFGALIVTVIAAVVYWSSREPAVPEMAEHYTAQQIENAENALKWTVAYISDVGARSGQAVRSEVFGSGVVQPVERAVKSTFESDPTNPQRDGGSL